MNQAQKVSSADFRLAAMTCDTTALSHHDAEALHRQASAEFGAAGRIEAASYHLELADWHAASMRKIATP